MSSSKRVIDASQVPQTHARARYLAQSIQLEEADLPGVVRGTVYVTAALFIGALIWAAATHVTETTTAVGEVVPGALNHRVQHLEGGIVEKLLVKNGDVVTAGQRLLSISSTAPESQLAQATVRKADLSLRAERLAALLEEREPVFDAWASDYQRMVDQQRTTFEAQRQSFTEQVRRARSHIHLRERELQQLGNGIAARKRESAILREQLEMRQAVQSSGLLARDEVLALEARLLERDVELQSTRDGARVAKAALENARIELAETRSRYVEALQLESVQVAAELTEVEKSLPQMGDRVRRTDVVAPVSGIVNNLSVNAAGIVVEPAATIMEIVPTDDRLIVDARISPSDIGHVATGQPVDVQVSAYDTARYGSLDGTLKRVSASTYLDEKREPYYRAEIELAGDTLVSDGNRFSIIPGMTVRANIITGEKSVLDYLLKPVYRGFQNSFHEQ